MWPLGADGLACAQDLVADPGRQSAALTATLDHVAWPSTGRSATVSQQDPLVTIDDGPGCLLPSTQATEKAAPTPPSSPLPAVLAPSAARALVKERLTHGEAMRAWRLAPSRRHLGSPAQRILCLADRLCHRLSEGVSALGLGTNQLELLFRQSSAYPVHRTPHLPVDGEQFCLQHVDRLPHRVSLGTMTSTGCPPNLCQLEGKTTLPSCAPLRITNELASTFIPGPSTRPSDVPKCPRPQYSICIESRNRRCHPTLYLSAPRSEATALVLVTPTPSPRISQSPSAPCLRPSCRSTSRAAPLARFITSATSYCSMGCTMLPTRLWNRWSLAIYA
jgi:hypothetical protein